MVIGLVVPAIVTIIPLRMVVVVVITAVIAAVMPAMPVGVNGRSQQHTNQG